MYRIILLAAVLLSFAFPVSAQWYGSAEVGINFGQSFNTTGTSNDRASVCDGYINPTYDQVERTPGYNDGNTNCTGPDRGATGDWTNRIGSDTGLLAGAAIGYRMRSGLRFEAEYYYRETGYDKTSTVDGASGESGDKIAQEIIRAVDSFGDMQSHNFFANVYWDFHNDSMFVPYVGAGVGVALAEIEYGSDWSRNSNAANISTGAGLPNADEIRQNLAGTSSYAEEELEDTLFGYQLIAGVDYKISNKALMGVKVRWVEFDSLKDGGVVWDPLRSHAPYLRTPDQVGPDGDQEYVDGDMKIHDVEMFTVSLGFKYLF